MITNADLIERLNGLAKDIALEPEGHLGPENTTAAHAARVIAEQMEELAVVGRERDEAMARAKTAETERDKWEQRARDWMSGMADQGIRAEHIAAAHIAAAIRALRSEK